MAIMADNSPDKQASQIDIINRAWQYHENADSLFHSRLTSFVTSQSFLIAGYVASFYMQSSNGFPEWYSIKVRLSVAVLGMLYSAAFFLVSNWLYQGMERLKRKYLAGKSRDDPIGDPVYKQYYYRTKWHAVLGEGKIGLIIPWGLPLGTLLFWVWLFALEYYRVNYH
jgi:hypothetical protein